jgi:hypothetical protein
MQTENRRCRRQPPLQLRPGAPGDRAPVFANGCGLGSWLPHLPDVNVWHGLSDGVLGLALLAITGDADLG